MRVELFHFAHIIEKIRKMACPISTPYFVSSKLPLAWEQDSHKQQWWQHRMLRSDSGDSEVKRKEPTCGQRGKHCVLLSESRAAATCYTSQVHSSQMWEGQRRGRGISQSQSQNSAQAPPEYLVTIALEFTTSAIHTESDLNQSRPIHCVLRWIDTILKDKGTQAINNTSFNT